jgi:large subunit ribosomal protein L18
MKSSNLKKEKRTRTHAKIRSKVFGTMEKPRLSVFKSNKHMLAQIIDDESGKTLAYAHSKDVKGKTMSEKAFLVGESVALKAKGLKIEKVVFDRGGFIYTGNIKALADGARKGGLIF